MLLKVVDKAIRHARKKACANLKPSGARSNARRIVLGRYWATHPGVPLSASSSWAHRQNARMDGMY